MAVAGSSGDHGIADMFAARALNCERTLLDQRGGFMSRIGATGMAWSKPGHLLSAVNDVLPRGGALSDDAWHVRHRGICVLLWVHVMALAAVGLFQGVSLRMALFESAAVAALTLAAMWGAGSRSFRSSMAVLGLLSSTAILIDDFNGLIEAHFHFFIVIVVVSLYQAWLPYLLAVSYVLFHHLVLGVMLPETVYNHHQAIEHPWFFAAAHAGAVLAESVACLVFWRATENSLDAERAIKEELVHSNAELTRANLAVSDLVAMLSHDLRVPLSVVIGYSEMARESWSEMGDGEKVDYVWKVHQAGKTMHEMLDGALTVSALDSDGIEPRRVAVRVDDAVRDALEHLPYAACVDLTGLAPATAIVDRGHLDQVLTNLLTNAYKYGGHAFAVSTAEVLDEVSIRISDAGPGVPPLFIPQLFGRFTRSEEARAGAQKGTGLGLYITRSLLLANEGGVHYEPTNGGGSTFCVRLPRYHRPRDPTIAPAELSHVSSNTR